MSLRKQITETISSIQMRTLELNAEYYGISSLQLMENAGQGAASEIVSRRPEAKGVVVLCGLGGNGGDGFVTARHLCSLGYNTTVLLAGKGESIKHEAALKNWQALQPLSRKISIGEISDSSMIPNIEPDVVVDALLGIGTRGRLKPPIVQLVEYINKLKAFKIALDAPTGIDSDTGEVLGTAVKADVTVTFHKPKFGLKKAKTFVGEIVVKDIGLPAELEGFVGPGDVVAACKSRPLQAHKGDFGRLLVIGGNEVYSGAPALVSLSALRTGVDIVYTAAPERVSLAMSSLSPDVITIKLEGKHLKPRNLDDVRPYIQIVDAIVLGPGLGLDPETKEFVKLCITEVENARKPLLLDADGLKAFSSFKRPIKAPFVLTPHAGEYTLLGSKLPYELGEKATIVQKTAVELNGVILLKGHVDIICSTSRRKFNFTGNPGMTVGGTGDVLSGIVGGLLAQKNDGFEAAVAGAFVNGAAGDFACGKFGQHMVASDILEWIPEVFNNPMSHIKVRAPFGKLA